MNPAAPVRRIMKQPFECERGKGGGRLKGNTKRPLRGGVYPRAGLRPDAGAPLPPRNACAGEARRWLRAREKIPMFDSCAPHYPGEPYSFLPKFPVAESSS